MSAASRGFPYGVEALVGAGADLHALDDDGWSSMTFAANSGNFECIDRLFGAGSDLEASNEGVPNPLAFAGTSGKISKVEKLLALGSESSAPSINGALIYAKANGFSDVAAALEGHFANLEKTELS